MLFAPRAKKAFATVNGGSDYSAETWLEGASLIRFTTFKDLLENQHSREVITFDFGTVAGEARAVDEFFADKNVVIKKLPIAHVPASVRK